MDRIEESGREYREETFALKKIQADLLTEGVKVFVALNGAGAVAILGFLHAIIGKTAQFNLFKTFGVWALFAFVVGAFFAACVFFARSEALHHFVQESGQERTWERRHGYLRYASMAAFLIGSAIAGIGIMWVL